MFNQVRSPCVRDRDLHVTIESGLAGNFQQNLCTKQVNLIAFSWSTLLKAPLIIFNSAGLKLRTVQHIVKVNILGHSVQQSIRHAACTYTSSSAIVKKLKINFGFKINLQS